MRRAKIRESQPTNPMGETMDLSLDAREYLLLALIIASALGFT